MPKTVRLNLEVSPKVRERLERLRKTTDAASLTEVFRRALAVYEVVAEHGVRGGRVELVASDGTTERLAIL